MELQGRWKSIWLYLCIIIWVICKSVWCDDFLLTFRLFDAFCLLLSNQDYTRFAIVDGKHVTLLCVFIVTFLWPDKQIIKIYLPDISLLSCKLCEGSFSTEINYNVARLCPCFAVQSMNNSRRPTPFVCCGFFCPNGGAVLKGDPLHPLPW